MIVDGYMSWFWGYNTSLLDKVVTRDTCDRFTAQNNLLIQETGYFGNKFCGMD